MPHEGLTQGISRNEVKVAISRMKNGKAREMDWIPVEVWKCLGEEGIDILCELMQGVYEQQKISIFIKRREIFRTVEITGG